MRYQEIFYEYMEHKREKPSSYTGGACPTARHIRGISPAIDAHPEIGGGRFSDYFAHFAAECGELMQNGDMSHKMLCANFFKYRATPKVQAMFAQAELFWGRVKDGLLKRFGARLRLATMFGGAFGETEMRPNILRPDGAAELDEAAEASAGYALYAWFRHAGTIYMKLHQYITYLVFCLSATLEAALLLTPALGERAETPEELEDRVKYDQEQLQDRRDDLGVAADTSLAEVERLEYARVLVKREVLLTIRRWALR